MRSCALDIATEARAAIGKMTFLGFDRGKLGTKPVGRRLRSAVESPLPFKILVFHFACPREVPFQPKGS
jgi:hypothetical protein